MANLIVHGKENIVSPAFYMPNRITAAAVKALHKLLDGKVCYLVDPTFPPTEAQGLSFCYRRALHTRWYHRYR